jgi:23S rRNA (guanosine2251-2'-O)-methyltransferase
MNFALRVPAHDLFMPLTLHNPHSVLAALDVRPKDVVEVRLGSRNPSAAWAEVADRAQPHRIPVSVARAEASGGRRNSKRESDTGRSGASAAVVRERGDVGLDELFAKRSPQHVESPESRVERVESEELRVESRNASDSQLSSLNSRLPSDSRHSTLDLAGSHPLFLALDCLHDPHNVGAIFRTAAFFGAAGIVVTRDRSAPLNATVYDVASGGMEVVPFSVQTNLRRALDAAKECGVWVLGTSEHAETDFTAIPLDRPWLLVVGNEETGLRRLTAEHCDMTCRIAARSTVTSLNVSVATGILIARFAGAAIGGN